MISKVQAQCCNTQSFKAKGSIAQEALSDLYVLTAERRNDGIAALALERIKDGFNIKGINAFSESGAARLTLSKNNQISKESKPSFLMQDPNKLRDADEITQIHDNNVYQKDILALKELGQFVAVA